MPLLATNGCRCRCSYGSSPSSLPAAPWASATCQGMGIATTADSGGGNAPSFGLCSSPDNPGHSTESGGDGDGPPCLPPCRPALSSPWTPGAKGLYVNGKPALTVDSRARCAYGGAISIVASTQHSCYVS